MPAKDYYGILGVDKNASADSIKSAYRKLAKKYHPDLHPGDSVAAEKFKECNEAYSVLGDADKRAKYDRGELDGDMNGGFNPFGGGAGGFSASGFDDIFDIFSGFMGGGSRSSSSRRASAVGSDITSNVELTFMEAILGTKKSISFTRIEKCPVCNGSGAKDSSSVRTCDKCNGSGQVRYVQNTIFGQQVTVGVCDKCNGSGKIVTDSCKNCHGKGVTSKKRVMNITIPAGVEDGAVLQIANEGNASRGNGRNGNLLLVLRVKPSKLFARKGLDLVVDVPVPFAVAALGGEIEIPSPQGVFIHKLAEDTGNGEVLRFRSRGVKTSRGAAGDLYVNIVVEVPKNITKQQRKILADFERDNSFKNYPNKKAYMDEISATFGAKK